MNMNYNFENLSSSEDSVISASFFLKKAPGDETVQNSEKTEKSPKLQNIKISNKKKSSFFGNLDLQKPLDTLGRFEQLENEIKMRSKNQANVLQSLSDIDISSDYEIKKDLAEIKEIKHKSSNDDAAKQTINLIEKLEPIRILDKMILPIESKNPPKSVMKKKKAKVTDSKKSVSFDLEETKYSPDEVSLDSFMEDVAQTSSVSDDITSLDEVLESKLQNIMSLDDLMPVNQLQLNISEVNDLVEIKSNKSSLSSVPTSINSPSSGSIKRKLNIRTIEDLTSMSHGSSNSSGRKKKQKTNKSRKEASVSETAVSTSSSIKELSGGPRADEAQKVLQSLESNIISRSDTLKDTDSISTEINEEFEEAAKSESSNISYSTNFSEFSSTKTKSLATPKQTDTSEYSSDFDTSETATEEAPLNLIKKLPAKSQIDPFKLPSPTLTNRYLYEPTHFMNNCSLTTKPPSNLTSFDDIMRFQIELTREFIERSNSLYKQAESVLPAKYHYTSLKDTKKMINNIRGKKTVA